MPDPLVTIRESAEALCDPRQHREPRHTWDAQRHRKPLPDHVTTLPGLIQQLRDMTAPGAAADTTGTRQIPDSRPPVTLDAVSLLASIDFGVARRVLEYGLERRDTVESTIRALVGHAPQLDHDAQRALAAEWRSWRNQAEVICRWRTGAVELVAPCPAEVGPGQVCGARGSLLANPDTHAAWCVACGTEWDPDQADDLFRWVRQYTERSRTEAEAKRAEVRAAKEREREAMAAALAARNGRSAA